MPVSLDHGRGFLGVPYVKSTAAADFFSWNDYGICDSLWRGGMKLEAEDDLEADLGTFLRSAQSVVSLRSLLALGSLSLLLRYM
jgi:hypothetical protein